MLQSDFHEGVQRVINLNEISSDVLERVCMYFYFKLQYTNSTGEIPEFDVDNENVMELLMAASFLDT